MPLVAMEKKINGLKREIKRAKLFEVQRLVRRLRQLANKKGTEAQIKKNQRKMERFEKELEFLKDVGLDEIARRIAKKEDEDGYESDQAIEDSMEDSHVDIDLQKRALDRIVNSTKIKEFLKKVDASSDDSANTKKESSDVEEPRRKKQQKLLKEKSKTKRTDNRRSVIKSQLSEEAHDDGNVNVYVEKPILKKQQKSAKVKLKATVACISEPLLQLDDKDKRSSGEDTLRLKNEQKAIKQDAWMSESPAFEPLVKEVDEDDGFLPSSDLSESDFEEDENDISSPELKPKGLESCFVETMSGLKEEKGMRGRKMQGKGKEKLVDKKGKRNRKGQRARQQMWEKVHGRGAKHLHKGKKEMKSKEKFNEEARKQTSSFKVQPSLKWKNDDETLHPSWEAMRRKRSQETLKVEFKGQKIKFDDSD